MTTYAYDTFLDRARWKLTFAFFPHKCYISNKLIWLTHAYCGTARWTGPGDDVLEHRWHTVEEHLIFKLKGN